MTIYKENRKLEVKEKKDFWVLSCKIDGLDVEYKVSKDLCADEEEMRSYIEAEKIF